MTEFVRAVKFFFKKPLSIAKLYTKKNTHAVAA
jgi:hypothetical protein